jgi:hypothetical protein
MVWLSVAAPLRAPAVHPARVQLPRRAAAVSGSADSAQNSLTVTPPPTHPPSLFLPPPPFSLPASVPPSLPSSLSLSSLSLSLSLSLSSQSAALQTPPGHGPATRPSTGPRLERRWRRRSAPRVAPGRESRAAVSVAVCVFGRGCHVPAGPVMRNCRRGAGVAWRAGSAASTDTATGAFDSSSPCPPAAPWPGPTTRPIPANWSMCLCRPTGQLVGAAPSAAVSPARRGRGPRAEGHVVADHDRVTVCDLIGTA